ncbi:MAG: hypothetical protein IJM19_03595 [Ruminococcus sp.]|nr:hypothetical protein [Ruminococcus sp.]
MNEEKSKNVTNPKKKGNGKKKKNEPWRHDPEYIAYCEHGDSAAVFILRDIVKNVDTSGYWIDIVESVVRKHYERFKEYSKGGRLLEIGRDAHDFEYFVGELFPRRTIPVYTEFMTDEQKKYLTWETAIIDIEEQHSEGYVGRKYKVYPILEMKTTVRKEDVVQYLSRSDEKWYDEDKFKGEFLKKRTIERTIEETKPDYKIKLVKRVK